MPVPKKWRKANALQAQHRTGVCLQLVTPCKTEAQGIEKETPRREAPRMCDIQRGLMQLREAAPQSCRHDKAWCLASMHGHVCEKIGGNFACVGENWGKHFTTHAIGNLQSR
jgi:hypothetical protein